MTTTVIDWPFPVVYGTIPSLKKIKVKTSIQLLCDWVNTHDCGVTPTGIIMGDSVIVRVDVVHKDGTHSIDRTPVKTLQQARVALGY